MGWLWVMVGMVGCLKPVAPVRVLDGMELRLVTVVDAVDDGAVTQAPQAVVEAVQSSLRRRGIQAVVEQVDLGAFTALRSTQARIERLDEAGAGPVLLVEAAPRFSAQVNGRYRWEVRGTVTVHGTLSARDPLTQTDAFRAPAHLVYSHQDEADALIDARSVVATRAGRLMDAWLVRVSQQGR
ncbi:MAG: hypothetical protein KTR31_26350 [Myxococcales bacterium]|nr:hypothetical protein [Myxococcales bacterium]